MAEGRDETATAARRVRPSRGGTWPELATWRQGALRLLAAWLLPPRDEVLAATPDAARYLRVQGPWTAYLAFHTQWEQFLRHAEVFSRSQRAALQDDYSRLFIDSPAVPLLESSYLRDGAPGTGALLGTLESEYMGAGLHLLGSRGVSPDHVVVELEFIAFLAGKEAEAWQSRQISHALEVLSHEKRFLDEHLCQWAPLLARAISGQDETGLYTKAAMASWAITAHDADFLGALTEHTKMMEIKRTQKE